MGKSLLPESALDDWCQWSSRLSSRPVLKKPLCGGRSNQSFLLESGIGHLVLRINGTGSLLPGADRSNEINIWKAASKQGIAPPLVFVDPKNQYLVSMYINNDLPPRPQNNEACVEEALRLLNSCHQLDVKAPGIDYFSHIEHYWQIIETGKQPVNPGLVSQRKPIQQTLNSLLNSNTPTGICHHDPVTANFVGTPNHLYLIDWEYAANGLQIMDYAALATEWHIDNQTILKRTGFTTASLADAKALYQYMCALWQAATSRD